VSADQTAPAPETTGRGLEKAKTPAPPEAATPGRQRWPRDRWYDVGYYVASGLGPLAVISYLMRLWAADLAVPFMYGGDALYYLGQIKGWLETGSYYVNSSIGAPGVSKMYDFPSADALNVALIWLLGLLSGGPGTAMNLFYLGGYVLTGLTTAFMARRLGLSRLAGLAVTFLYLFIPYHWLRGEGHLFLAMFWIVPLQVLVLFWLDSSEPPLVATSGRFWSLNLRSRRSIAALVISACAGALGIYYLFFGCFFLVLVALRRGLQDRVWRPALAAGVLILLMTAVFLVQVAPTLVYQQRHGKNPEAVPRSPFEAELYGLRVTQMLLPTDYHRIQALADKRANYRLMSPSGDTEANTAALGVVGSVGFVLCVAALLFGWPRDRGRDGPDTPGPPAGHVVGLRWLGFLTLGALLLATVAGFGAVFAGAGLSQIRGYNRISVYIALFSLLLLGVLADRVVWRRSSTARHAIWVALLLVVVVGGILDQTPAKLWLSRAHTETTYDVDAAFGRQVQAALPAGAVVFQLPYIPYPGYGVVNGLQEYEPLQGYVHTEGFRWSYGAMKGRPDAKWQEATAQLPPEQLVVKLREAGFDTLWIQLDAYEDGGKELVAQYVKLLGQPVTVKPDGSVAVWRL
jgi:phosphoglycerol transferase